MRWLPDGDHSFRPRKKSGHTEEQNRETAVTEIKLFVRDIMESRNKQSRHKRSTARRARLWRS